MDGRRRARIACLGIAIALAGCRPTAEPAAPAVSAMTAPAPVGAGSAGVPSWSDERKAARAALDAHDYRAYRRRIDALYARSGSIWVLRDRARANALLDD